LAKVSEADVLTHVLVAVRQQAARRGMAADITAGELAEALWLCQQGMPVTAHGEAHLAAMRHPAPDRAALPAPEATASSDAGTRPRTSTVEAYLAEQAQSGSEEPFTVGWLPDPPALPRSRKLAQVLRPLRYEARRVPLQVRIDEEATALQIASTGIRRPVWRATRRRRLDLDLILDLGGSGPLWQQLALECKAMLESTGAFRNVRYWTLDTDSADLALSVGALDPEGLTLPGQSLPPSTVCQAPRKPVVVVLTDGTGRAWDDGRVHGHLWRWAESGIIAVAQVLPGQMWDRTALQSVPVTFHPADDGSYRGSRVAINEMDASIAGMDGKQLRDALAVPVVELDEAWLRAWVALLRGSRAGSVAGYALLVPPPSGRPGERQSPDRNQPPPGGEVTEPAAGWGDPEPPSAEQRVRRFLVNASGDAITLARLLSTGPVNLSIMRKVRQELLPSAKPSVIAEVMLSGLLYWTEPAGTLASFGGMRLRWHLGVDELLQARPGGVSEFRRDKELVTNALARSDGQAWRDFRVFLAGAGGVGLTSLESGTQPFAEVPVLTAETVSAGEREPPKYPPDPAIRTVRVGIWGSTASGRTTYLTVLAGIAGWQSKPGSKDQWRVTAADEETRKRVRQFAGALEDDKQFPAGNLPGQPISWSFILERRRPEEDKNGLFRFWRQVEQVAAVSVELQDRASSDYYPHEQATPRAISYLAESDLLLYFFDPTYDLPWRMEREAKGRSFDFFATVETYLGEHAVRDGALDGPFLRKHIAVCIPKLDDQEVFAEARRAGYLDTDPDGMPWVSEKKAQLFFQRICQDPNRLGAYYVVERLQSAFRPDRISYHALSSIGYWIPPDGQFNPTDVCNVTRPESEERGQLPRPQVRGQIQPLHVLDPLIALAERVSKERASAEGNR